MQNSRIKLRADASLNDTLSFLRKWLVLAVICGLAAGAAAYVARKSVAATYTAESSLLLTAPQAGLESIGVVTPPMVDPAVYRAAILEGGILRTVLQQLSQPADALAQRDFGKRLSVSIENQQISSVIRIKARADTAQVAALTANMLAAEAMQWDRERGRQALRTSVTALQASLLEVDARLAAVAGGEAGEALLATRAQLSTEMAAASERSESLAIAPLIRVLHEAGPPLEADGSGAIMFAAVAFILAAGLLLGVVWLWTELRDGLQQPGDAERATSLPVAAVFPAATSRHALQMRRDAADILRSRLSNDSVFAEPVVILVTSPTDASEKDGLAIALAESFGRAGRQTLLVDGNLRTPSTGQEFRLSEGECVSFEQYLTDPSKRLEFVSVRLQGRPVFSLIPSFTAAGWPADLLRGSFAQLMKQWQKRFPVIIVDATPLLPFPDTEAILGGADAVILVGRLGLTKPAALGQAAEALMALHSKMPKLVVSDARSTLARFQHGGQAANDYAISILRAPRKAPLDASEAVVSDSHNLRVPSER